MGPRDYKVVNAFIVSNNHSTSYSARLISRFITAIFACALIAALSFTAVAQTNLSFEVSNPKQKNWSPEQAERIYSSACDLLARAVRPEKPPQLHPKFRLVLGADHDEFMRLGSEVEIRLKNWQPAKFAEAVVMVATREVLQEKDLNQIVRQSLYLANATVPVSQLRENR